MAVAGVGQGNAAVEVARMPNNPGVPLNSPNVETRTQEPKADRAEISTKAKELSAVRSANMSAEEAMESPAVQTREGESTAE
jgi:hypothetical protein